jgi:hypothetical protein
MMESSYFKALKAQLLFGHTFSCLCNGLIFILRCPVSKSEASCSRPVNIFFLSRHSLLKSSQSRMLQPHNIVFPPVTND